PIFLPSPLCEERIADFKTFLFTKLTHKNCRFPTRALTLPHPALESCSSMTSTKLCGNCIACCAPVQRPVSRFGTLLSSPIFKAQLGSSSDMWAGPPSLQEDRIRFVSRCRGGCPPFWETRDFPRSRKKSYRCRGPGRVLLKSCGSRRRQSLPRFEVFWIESPPR